jgi:DNA-binding transcriptional ArsR family regulator
VPGRPVFERKAELFRTLGHPGRIRILELLAEGEQSVSQLQPQVGLESSHLSQQLAVLRRAGLVAPRREGSAVFYSLTSPVVADLMAAARRLLTEVLAGHADALAELRDHQER